MQSGGAVGEGIATTEWLLSHWHLLEMSVLQDTASCHLYTAIDQEFLLILDHDYWKDLDKKERT